MLAFTNRTRYAAQVAVMTDADGAEVLIVVAKGAFGLEPEGDPVLAGEPPELLLADAYGGEPGVSSLVAPSDFALFKPATDVAVLGAAHAPLGRKVDEMEVEVRVGKLGRRVRVVGDRVWKKGPFGVAAGRPKPFVEMPLVFERAFGGACPAKEKNGGDVRYAANPIGAGFWMRPADADGQPLPNLEDPEEPVKSLKDHPEPFGLGFVAPNWEPRRGWAGTYDEAWEKRRMPLLPEDFDYRFFNAAPAALQSSGYLQGGERVRLRGLHPRGDLAFHLPGDTLKARLLFPADVLEEHALALDTVVIEPGAGRVLLAWRAKLPTPQPIARLLHVELESERHPAPKAEEAEVEVTAGGVSG